LGIDKNKSITIDDEQTTKYNYHSYIRSATFY